MVWLKNSQGTKWLGGTGSAVRGKVKVKQKPRGQGGRRIIGELVNQLLGFATVGLLGKSKQQTSLTCGEINVDESHATIRKTSPEKQIQDVQIPWNGRKWHVVPNIFIVGNGTWWYKFMGLLKGHLIVHWKIGWLVYACIICQTPKIHKQNKALRIAS